MAAGRVHIWRTTCYNQCMTHHNANYTRIHDSQMHIRLPYRMKVDLDKLALRQHKKTAVLVRDLIAKALEEDRNPRAQVETSQRLTEISDEPSSDGREWAREMIDQASDLPPQLSTDDGHLVLAAMDECPSPDCDSHTASLVDGSFMCNACGQDWTPNVELTPTVNYYVERSPDDDPTIAYAMLRGDDTCPGRNCSSVLAYWARDHFECHGCGLTWRHTGTKA